VNIQAWYGFPRFTASLHDFGETSLEK